MVDEKTMEKAYRVMITQMVNSIQETIKEKNSREDKPSDSLTDVVMEHVERFLREFALNDSVVKASALLLTTVLIAEELKSTR